MTSILKTELFRLKKSKAFWALWIVCAALPVVSLVFILLFFELIKSLFEGAMDNNVFGELSEFLALSGIASVDSVASTCGILTLIATAVVLSREFTHGTARNMILANKSREQMFFAFLITAAIVASCYMTTEFVVTALLFGAAFGFGEIAVGEVVTGILCHLVLGICAMLFIITLVCMFLFATRKQNLTIIFPLLVVFIAPSLIDTVVSAIVMALSMSGQTVSETALKCVPFYNLALIEPAHPAGLAMGMAVLYYLLFSAMFFVIGFFTFRKSDLK